MIDMARPTKYTPELLEAARAYLVNYEDHEHAFPSAVGLADVLEIGETTLYRWAGEEGKEEFRDILDAINRKQQLVAWNKGLKGDYNANLVKLLLGKHGYHDKQDQTLSAPGGGPIRHEHTMTPSRAREILERHGIDPESIGSGE